MSGEPTSCLAIAAAVQSGERTARSVAEDALARARRHQDRSPTFITLTPELARAEADRVDGLVSQRRRLPLQQNIHT